ncbi:MAG: heme-dependent oxidative N-demethylase family protein [Rhizobiaceae bacterium]
MLPKHTPFADPSVSFSIGLRPLDLVNWIEVDEYLLRYLEEKLRLMSEIPGKVFVSEAGSEAAQQEVLDLLVPHLTETFPEIYSRFSNSIQLEGLDRRVDLDDPQLMPLLKAAYLVQEDLVLMRKGESGWRLSAGSVCFPSSWVLLEKFGKAMHKIHAPVPGFAKGTRNAMMIERVFDNLLVEQPVERFNWSVYSDDVLYHDDRFGEHFPADEGEESTPYFLRIEHQTLRKLPISGDILFTIRIHIDPIEMLLKRSDRDEIIPGFIKTIRAMNNDEMEYKGFDQGMEQLIKRLESML